MYNEISTPTTTPIAPTNKYDAMTDVKARTTVILTTVIWCNKLFN